MDPIVYLLSGTGGFGGPGHPLKVQRSYPPIMRPWGDWGIPIKVRIACLIVRPLGVCHEWTQCYSKGVDTPFFNKLLENKYRGHDIGEVDYS